MPADPFRRLVLDTVAVIVKKEPNGDTLLELLRVATPDLDEDEVIKDASKRDKLFKKLLLRIHPDHHLSDSIVTPLYQDVTPFYDKCVSNIHKRPSKVKAAPPPPVFVPQRQRSAPDLHKRSSKPQRRPSESVKIEFEFTVRKKWPYLALDQPAFPMKECSADGLSALVAYQCINSRGAIAHGRRTERFYSTEQVLQKPATAYEKFAARGGVKTFEGQNDSIESLKGEIVTHGPVVSTSFFLTEAFAKQPENKGHFMTNRIGRLHPLLIVGWRVTNLGDVWICSPLKRNSKTTNSTFITVPFRKYDIDTTVLAPANTFENVPWQNGPYFDHDMSAAPDWTTWPSLRMHLSPEELQNFMECVVSAEDAANVGLIGLYEKKTTFVVRHRDKLAKSRRCRLKEVKWDKKLGKWLVSCTFL